MRGFLPFVAAAAIYFLLLSGRPLLADHDEKKPAADSAVKAPAKTEPTKSDPAKSDPAKPVDAQAKPGEPLAGHSLHGEAFNEGPRQAARLLPGQGHIQFAATTMNEQARKFIEQGVGQLHGFYYFEAERSFRQAAALDANCAIAYWGMAMANINTEPRAKGFIAEAVKRKEKASRREQMYIEALDAFIKSGPSKKKERGEAYVKALEKLLLEFPDDLNAKAWLALAIWTNRDNGIPIQSFLAVDALLDQVFKAEPLHPAHHYRIHLWDAEKAEKALGSAAVCGQAAPGIAHMWHMPGHIYSKLRRYADAAWQQEASARVDYAHMMEDGVLPDRIHNFAHNNEWLIKNLVYLGRAHDALELSKNMIELPRHPKLNTLAKRGSGAYGRARLFDTLQNFERWDELIALCDTAYLEPTDDDAEQIKRLRALGRAHYRAGHLEPAKQILDQLRNQLAEKRAEREKAGKEAEQKAAKEKKSAKEIEKAKNEARRSLDSAIARREKAIQELQGLAAVAAGDLAFALELLNKSDDKDPLYLAKLELKHGQAKEAEERIRKDVKSHPGEVLPLAGLVELLWLAGKQDEARKAFDQLREISGWLEIEEAPFARLAPIAKSLKFPADWRVKKPAPTDIGQRPSLEELGPFRWQPQSAPAWQLQSVEGKPVSLAAYEGKPVVLIFYLGYGCLHCAEQLAAFGPRTKDFADAGIAIVSISSDDEAGLKQSVKDYKGPKPFPFPLLSDSKHEAFKAYRAYDDFEKQPLHATVLIDGQGKVRWHDIGHQPFTDVNFLLGEAKRLLAVKPPVAAQ